MLYGSVFMEDGSRVRPSAIFFTTSSRGICSKCVPDFNVSWTVFIFVMQEQ